MVVTRECCAEIPQRVLGARGVKPGVGFQAAVLTALGQYKFVFVFFFKLLDEHEDCHFFFKFSRVKMLSKILSPTATIISFVRRHVWEDVIPEQTLIL